MNSLVLDTSTLILMAKIDLLGTLATQIAIVLPEAVNREATVKPELDDAKMIKRLIEEAKIKINKVKESSIVDTFILDFRLGEGEAQAIALAKSKNLTLGVDDWQAIKTCKVMGVPFVTTLAFVTRFHEKEIITEKQALAKLEKLKQYGWYQKDLLEKVANDIKGVK
jgi:predicted nucleic acid-binding protein